MRKILSEVTPEIENLAQLCVECDKIDFSLYEKHDVKRGLRDINGKGVVAGLTEISEIRAAKIEDGKEIPCEGELYYRGYNIKELVNGFLADGRFGFEETVYLLLFGKLPNAEELGELNELLGKYRTLPVDFVRDIILKAPSSDMMNTLSRSVLTLYSYDDNANALDIPNVLRQSIELIALFPVLAVYGYQAYNHYYKKESLFIHRPNPKLSTAENILMLLRPDEKYTALEAKILDLALVLQAEHGGGNNSTFTAHVVTSSGTDTYSALSAAIASLKGFRHGGANLKVKHMMEDIMAHLNDWEDENEIREYLVKILNKDAFDKTGLIYGIGHAVYTESDPREVILKEYAQKLASAKGREKEFELYDRIERIAKETIAQHRHLFKPICANVDFYSGFVYDILGIPESLFTPIFAVSRMSGWSAHRLEEIINKGKIIRPAYKYVGVHKEYRAMDFRKI